MHELSGLKVLILSYYFPPLSSAGGHRTGAFARHLALHGAAVRVVSVKNGLDVSDPALVEKLPKSIEIVRVPSFEGAKIRTRARDRYKHERLELDANSKPSIAQRVLLAGAWGLSIAKAFLPWALRRFWFACFASRAVKREIRNHRPDAVMVSLGPMSQTWAAVRATRRSGVPLIFDFRDLWTTAPEYWANVLQYKITHPVAWFDRAIERRVLRHPDLFIANHEHMKQTLEKLAPRAVNRTIVIPNGYEEQDFAGLEADGNRAGDGRVVIRSAGTTYTGTVQPLLAAAERLAPEVAAKVRIEMMGPYYDTVDDLDRADGINVVEIWPPRPHTEALKAMASADVLLFLLRDTPGIDDMIPARLYEYLRIGKPILALAPDGAAKDLVLKAGGTVIHPRDTDALRQVLEQIATGGSLPGSADPASELVHQFDRSSQALRLGRAMLELKATP